MSIPALSVEQLAPVVRRALGTSDAWPLDWSCEQLDGALVNPTTDGLYRVVGTAQAETGSPRPWRMILKVLCLPDLSGTPLESGYALRPEDWNYWRREALALRSGLLDRFDWPLRAVKCWGIDDVDNSTAWIWLEELDTRSPRPHWSLEELSASAHDWGAFSAQGIALVDEVESLPWSARGWLRGWVGTARVMGAEHATTHDGCWEHPLVRDRLPASAHASFRKLMGIADRLMDRLDSLPRTVAHHDTSWFNVFAETGPHGRGTVAIDWSFLGTAPVGGDLGHHIAANVFLRAIAPRDAEAHVQAATAAYLEGLRAYGWRGDEKDVRFAAAATGALQHLSFAACHLAMLCPQYGEVERWPEELADSESTHVDAVMDDWCKAFRVLSTLGERARLSLVED